ncbi:glycoside hydrolase family 114 protein [Piromyces sp. E2]|nr:glycoside hydrolase family 114 protein [Piromyces sp. E2]|eukprot:OUM58016.1 glycoside hydrolase family 114 protein [Piromyces sp. E2]
MKFLLLVTLLSSTLLANVNAARWCPQPGLTWDYLLGGEVNDIDRDVVTFDLEYAEKMVPILHKRGQKAVCYFSGGTTENRSSRPDIKDYEKAGLAIKETNDGWDNYMLDVRKKSKLQPLIRKRFQRAVKYGCDAVEVDVLDVHQHYNKFTKQDSYNFAKWVAETGHEENISVTLKNLAGQAEALEPFFDFATVESCVDYNECKHFKKFTQNNKAVFIVQYKDHPNSKWKLTDAKLKNKLIEAQKNSGFICVLSNLNLQSHSENYNCNTGALISKYYLLFYTLYFYFYFCFYIII